MIKLRGIVDPANFPGLVETLETNGEDYIKENAHEVCNVTASSEVKEFVKSIIASIEAFELVEGLRYNTIECVEGHLGVPMTPSKHLVIPFLT
jgi:hypothetical protein